LRLVLASPSDVESEWKLVSKIVAELNHGMAAELGFRVDVATWQTDVFPGFHPLGPQGHIDALLKIEDADILLAIFWTRFGTPVADAQSGTQHEIMRAISAWTARGTPHVMVYFKTAPYSPSTRDESEQWSKVLAFRDSFPHGGLWGSFRTRSQFEDQIRRDLTNVLRAHKSVRRRPPSSEALDATQERSSSQAPEATPQPVATLEPPKLSASRPEHLDSTPPAAVADVALPTTARAHHGEPPSLTASIPAAKSSLALELQNTTWHIGCKRCKEKSRWIYLRADTFFEFKFGNDADFRFEGDDTWRVEGNKLILSWRSGQGVETFTFSDLTATTAFGTSVNVRGTLRLTRSINAVQV
jgi:hypothetical protein